VCKVAEILMDPESGATNPLFASLSQQPRQGLLQVYESRQPVTPLFWKLLSVLTVSLLSTSVPRLPWQQKEAAGYEGFGS
jgi:hypothetical protein